MKRLLLLLPLLACACGIMPVHGKSDVLPSPQPTVESHQNAQEAPGTKLDGISSHSTPKTELCVSAAESLNLRSAPSTSAEGLDVLLHGDRVVRIGAVAGWLKVEAADGRIGWVKAEFVSVCDG